jgi:hypothetical protein
MSAWTHLIRFEALEDRRVHLGQLEDIDADVGLKLEKGIPVKAYRLSGDSFTGLVTSDLLTVLRVSHWFKYCGNLRKDVVAATDIMEGFGASVSGAMQLHSMHGLKLPRPCKGQSHGSSDAQRVLKRWYHRKRTCSCRKLRLCSPNLVLH